jgi:ATP-dependent helicase/nuclease subunit B
MGLQLILGGSGTGKSYLLYESVVKKSIACPEESFMTIVPEQFTMATQRRIVQTSPRRGSMNIDILSFERFAKRIFEEAGLQTLQVLDDTGKCLILRKVMEEKKEELSVFGKKVRMAGFVEEMKSVISEFCQYGINEEAITKIQEQLGEQPLLLAKFQDIAIILRGFQEYLENRFIINEELLVRVCELIPHSNLVKNCHVVLDEYTGFTPVQYQVLQGLLQYAKSVTVVLSIRDVTDKSVRKEREQDIFLLTVKTANRLKQLAKDLGVEIHSDRLLSTCRRFVGHQDLEHLERSIFQYSIKKQPWKGDIELAVCTTPVMEADYVAQRIFELVREQKLRYREIAVLTPDMESYHRALGDAFAKYEIPCFIDYKRSIRANPMVEAIRGALEIVKEHFSYESVFRFLRTYMSSLEMEEIDLLENHVLAKGIRGYKRWTGDFRTEQADILQARDLFLEDIRTLYENLKVGNGKKGISVRTAITELYQFGVRIGLEQKTLALQERFEKMGELSLAKEYQQSYRKVMELYDKTILLLGEETLSLTELIGILDAGFEEIKVGVIPPTLDGVQIGDIERTRLSDVKVLFLVGANDGLIPKAASKKGILTQAERAFLETQGMELSPTERESSFIQKFYLYMMLTKASEHLYISYKRTNGAGESCRASYLVGHIRKLFTDLQVLDWEKELQKHPIVQIANEKTAYAYLAENLGEYLEKRSNPLTREVYQELRNRNLNPEQLLEATKTGKQDSKLRKNLQNAVAEILYGTCLHNSVSRLEQFAKCPYQHFIDYGLQLVERKHYEVLHTDIGNIYHEALDNFSKCLKERNLSWKELSDETREQIVKEILQEIEEKHENQAIHDTARNRYMFQSIKNITTKTVEVLQRQIQQSDFLPQGFEVRFSSERGLENLSCQYEDGKTMELKGTLDRVDYYYAGDDIYIKIIDYKSGAKKFSISDVYNHLQLQLVVYMEAAVAMAKKRFPNKQIHPAGIFYYTIDDPVLEVNSEGQTTEQLKEAYQRALRPNGIMSNEQQIIEALDNELRKEHTDAYTSNVIPLKKNKNGSLSADSSCISSEEFQAMLTYTGQEVYQLGKDIINGVIEARPCAKKKKSGLPDADSAPCSYCQYHSICGFDKSMSDAQYRIVENKGIQDICDIVAERGKKDAVVTTTEEGN